MADKKKYFVILIVIFAAVLTYRLLNPFQQPTVAELTHTGKVPARTEPSSGKDVRNQNHLLLDLYVNPPRHSAVTLKNVFFPSSLRNDAASPPALTQPAAVAENAKDSVVAPPTPKGLGNIAVFGFYRNQKDEVLFIERGKDILTVRQGDRIDGKYLVKAITETSMVVTVNGDEIVVDFDI